MLICAVLTANNVCRSEDSDTACPTKADLGAKYLFFFTLVPSKREKNVLVLLSLYIF